MQILDKIYGFLWKSPSVNNCNTYFIDGPARILIDPGHLSLFDHVRKNLAALKLSLSDIDLIICTHAHPDHTEAVQLFADEPAMLAIHESEWQSVRSMAKHIQTAGFRLEAFTPDFFIKEGILRVHGRMLQIFHTPGHSPGSVCIYLPDQKTLFTGDLIFKDGIGRTDLPGGNSSSIRESIERMSGLDVGMILPGHGNIISGAADVRQNFIRLEQYRFGYL